jgi:hypothetical protein
MTSNRNTGEPPVRLQTITCSELCDHADQSREPVRTVTKLWSRQEADPAPNTWWVRLADARLCLTCIHSTTSHRGAVARLSQTAVGSFGKSSFQELPAVGECNASVARTLPSAMRPSGTICLGIPKALPGPWRTAVSAPRKLA